MPTITVSRTCNNISFRFASEFDINWYCHIVNDVNQSLCIDLCRSRLVKAEILAHEQSCITVEMLSMFVVAYEEQARTEEILRLALPQLRSKHLLLASFGTFEEENEQFRVSVAQR